MKRARFKAFTSMERDSYQRFTFPYALFLSKRPFECTIGNNREGKGGGRQFLIKGKKGKKNNNKKKIMITIIGLNNTSFIARHSLLDESN